MSTANATDTTITCEWCGNDLEKEEMESPLSSDETICDGCYDEHYRFTCHWCEENEDKKHECTIGSLFILFKPVWAQPPFLRHSLRPLWYSRREREMRPGIYRIVRYPFYWDACLDGGLYADAFEWFGPLTSGMKKNGGYADYDCGPLCRRCQRTLKHAKWHWPGEMEGNNV